MLYARRGGRLQSQLKAVCRDARAAPRGTRPELHTQGGGASAQRAGRAACARRGTLHALPHPAETESPTCGVAPTQSLPTSPTSLTRPCAPAGRGGARRPANERAPGTTPRGTPVWVSARARAARGPHASSRPGRATRSRRRYEPPNPARHGVRAHLFRVSSDKLRVKRARTPYTARYVKGPRRPTLPGGRLLSHAEGTVDFFSFDQFAWSWLSVGGRRTLTRHRSSSCSRQPQRG